ncbi:MAG: crossover junction endodeoxyribonuclease RuvC [Microgenomates group bacterium]
MIVLAIDPGVERFGFALLEKVNGTIRYISSGVIVTKKTLSHAKRVGQIYSELLPLLKKYRPKQIVFERLFFSKNVTTAIAVAQVQGIVYLTAFQNNIPAFEIAPNTIKSVVTGYGQADKKAVQKMVEMQLTLPKRKRLDDEYDAIACGYAYLLQER